MSIRKIDVNIGTVPKWGDDDFDEKVHDNFLKLDQVIPKINLTVGDIDATVITIEKIENIIKSQSSQISSYLEETKKLKEDAVLVKNSAENTKEEIKTLLEATDITGTAGYTIDAIDDLISRNRNMHFVNANII